MLCMESLDFSPMSLLQADLSSTGRASRLRAIRGLRSISAALGCEYTRTELMREIQGHIMRECDDEVLYELAGTLGNFFDEIGGVQHAAVLFGPLRELARIEETIVHTRAKESLVSVINATDVDCVLPPVLSSSEFSTARTCEYFVPLLAIHTVQQLGGMEVKPFDTLEMTSTATSQSLSSSTTGLGAKVSAAGLVAPTIRLLTRFNRLQEHLKDILEVYRKLAFNDAPSVRRSAAAELAALSGCVTPGVFGEYFADVVWALLADEQESVRLATVETLGRNILALHPAIACAWSDATREILYREASGITSYTTLSLDESGDTADTEDNDAVLLRQVGNVQQHDQRLDDPTATVGATASQDTSWRVREALARSFAGYLAHFWRTTSDDYLGGANYLLHIFAKLFIDCEVEVRIAAFEAMNEVASITPTTFANNAECIHCACNGAEHSEHPRVRVAAARGLTRLLATLSPESLGISEQFPAGSTIVLVDQVQQTLFETIETKLFAYDNVDVLLAILDQLSDVIPHLTDETANKVALIVQNMEHENWRVRRALNSILPAVAAKQGRDAFESHLLKRFISSFQDRICQVRASAVDALASLRDLSHCKASTAPVFDVSWLIVNVGKSLSENYSKVSYYVYRITIVQAFEQLAADSSIRTDDTEAILTFLTRALEDDVPNVRLTAVRALHTSARFVDDRFVKQYIHPALTKLGDEEDMDVQFAVDRALKAS